MALKQMALAVITLVLSSPVMALNGIGHKTDNSDQKLSLSRSEAGHTDRLGINRAGAGDEHKSPQQPISNSDRRLVDRRLQDRRAATPDDNSWITFGKKKDEPRRGPSNRM